MEVRKATIQDLEEIQKLNLLLFKKEYSEYDKLLNCDWTFGKKGTEYFKDKILSKDNCAFVVIKDGKIVGYLVGGITEGETYRTLPIVAELDNTLVLKEDRGLGIGSALYKEFIKWCKSKKVKIIKVQATAQNEKAIGFYRKNGFKDYTLTLEHHLG
jgi:diamine N-acetyltransferase